MPLVRVSEMPFYVRLASNEKPRLSAPTAISEPQGSNNLREFCQGISFGVGLFLALIVAFWLISAATGNLPTLQSLQTYWLAAH